MRKLLTLLVLALSLAAVGGVAGVAVADSDATTGATVSGTVSSGAADGSLPGDASVVLKQGDTVVDSTYVESDGSFAFHGVADGTYTLVVRADDHRTATTASFDVSGGADVTGQDVTLDGPVLNTDTGDSWTAIQPALDAAATGETITVGPGTYSEALTVATDGLTLRSTDGAAETTVTASSGPAIEIDGSNGGATGVAIDGFTLQGTASNVVNTFNVDDITLRNSVVDSAAAGGSANGMFTDGTATVDNVEFRDTDNFGVGLLVSGAAAGTTVADSEFSGYDSGLRIEDSPDALVSGVVATENDLNGIFLDNADGSLLRYIDVSSTFNDVSQNGRALQIYNSENVAVTNAQLGPSNTDAVGVRADDGGTYDLSTITFSETNVVTNGFGMFTSASGGSTLNNNVVATGNYFSGNGGDTCCQIDASGKVSSAYTAGRDALVDVTGTVSSAAADASVGSGVPVRLEQGGTLIESVTTDSGGNYEFRNVTDGSYTVVADAPAHQQMSASVSVSGSSETQDLVLDGAVENERSGETFTSIGSAIDAGSYDVSSGDTITVYPGRYAESVNFAGVSSASDLTITSAGAATETVVVGQGSVPTFNVDTDGITVDGFTITGSGPGLLVNTFDTTQHTVRNNIVRASGGQVGVNIGETVSVTDNEITSSAPEATGIKLYDGGASGTTITGNEVTGFGNATTAINVNDLTIERNRFANNGDAPGEDAINLDIDSGVTIDASTITVARNNVVDNNFGLSVESAGTVTGEIDAELNWWGSADGPSASGANGVTGAVDVEPWLDGPVPDGTAVPTQISATVAVPDPPGAGDTATYRTDLTYDQVGDETVEYISVDFGTGTVDLSGVAASDVTVQDSSDTEVTVDSVQTVDSGQTLVVALGTAIDDPASGETYTVVVEGVTNGDAGTYTLTTGLHESGSAVGGVAGDAVASGSGDYELSATPPVVTATGGTVEQGSTVTVDVSIDNSKAVKLSGIPDGWSVSDRTDNGAYTGTTTRAGWVWETGGSHTASVTLSVPADAPTGDLDLTATTQDSAGVTETDTATVTVERPPDTTAPTAALGSDVTVQPGESVVFDATGSTDNVGITNYEWDFGDGSGATGPELSTPPSKTYDSAGTYTVTLTVSDAAGNTATATRTVTVDGEAPAAIIGSDRTVTAGEAVSFDATDSDDDNGVASYQWSFGDGGAGFGPTPTHTYDSAGTYTATLTVTDAAGNTDTDSVTVTVEARPDTTAPTVDAGSDRSAVVNEDIRFDATGSTDNEGIVSYDWEFGDGTTASSARPRHVYESPGTYTATLTVTDAAGNTATDSVTVTVEALDRTAPTADAGSGSTVVVGETVAFDGTASADNDGIVSYEWAFGDGATTAGPTPAHAYDSPGTYTATLTVADAAGNTDTDAVTVFVRPTPDTTPPTAEAGPNVTVSVGDSVTLDASGSTDDQGLLGYQWTLGDGSSATGQTVTHTYDSAGTYTATVTVADASRNTDTDSVTVTVVEDDATNDTATVTTVPSNVTVANGSVRAVDVAVRDGSSGVGTYALSLSLSNATGNATIANASVPNGTVESQSARTVVLSGTADSTASNVTVATVRLTGVETGSVDVALTADAVTTADGGQYDALSTAGGIVEVVPGPEPLPGSAAPPRDADGDGRFEDVNGDRTADLFDALDYFNQRGSEVIRDNPDRFDFDGDGDAGDLFDALALWNEISG